MQSNRKQRFYNYRDESLSSLAMGDPIAVERRRHFYWLRFLVKFFFVALTIGCAMILPFHYSAVYATYRQSTCTITYKQVQEYDSRDKHGNITSRSYNPVFSYTVNTGDDGQVTASGFDGPTSASYDDSGEAQAIVNQYMTGQNVSCWYNPTNPSHAFIVFYGYSSSAAFGTFLLGVFFASILFIVVYLLFDWTVWRLYALAKRGVLVDGNVEKHKTLRSKSGTRIVSIVMFQAAEEGANKERSIVVSKEFPIGSQVQVCYDPFYPRYRRSYNWPITTMYIVGIMPIGVILIVAFIVMVNLWLIP